MLCEVRIDAFEGPLDLLLHLIRKNEVDIYDIPMAEITAQYLAYLDAMKHLNLDVAGEFLLMAATLIHIKSRLLLPTPDEESDEEEGEDPRAELVRRLLEYQKYQAAASDFDALPQLGRDVFVRLGETTGDDEEEIPEFEAIGLFELVEAFRALLRDAPPDVVHEVTIEQLSVTERIHAILTRFDGVASLTFSELFPAGAPRGEVVVSFLAMLELVKMKLLKIMQNRPDGTIWLFPAVSGEESLVAGEESLGYQ